MGKLSMLFRYGFTPSDRLVFAFPVIGQWVRTQDFRELKTEIAQDMT